jgi:hypothetical protein
MADTTTNFFINSAYSPSFDITWSFQFKLSSGDTNATGGFSTFLFNNKKLDGGGKYSGLGFAPFQINKGVVGATVGVMITNDAKLIVKNGKTFSNIITINNLLSTININSNTLINQNFLTIRFNLTDLGKTLNISLKEPATDRYKTISNVDTGLNVIDSDFYKIGFGYSSPLSSNGPKLSLLLKDLHSQGSFDKPVTKISTPPFIFPLTESNYIIQSPTLGKLQIGIPDPIIDGYIMHNSTES